MFVFLFDSFVFSASILIRSLLLLFLLIPNGQNPPSIKYISPIVPVKHKNWSYLTLMYYQWSISKENSNLNASKYSSFTFRFWFSALLEKDFVCSGSFTHYETFGNLIQLHTYPFSDNSWFENFQECLCSRVLFSKVANSTKSLLLTRTTSEVLFQGVGGVLKFARTATIDN